jgi:hypothetical protein
MKKTVSIGFLLLNCLFCINAQTFNADEVAKMKTFLTQASSEEGKKNYELLGITDIETVDWATVDGLTWNQNGNLETILWASKKLSGDLDISNFPALRKVHCEYNTIQSINIEGSTNLSYMDCYNNDLKTIDLTTNLELDSFCCRYNQLKEIDLTKNTKLIYFCGSGNKFEYFDLSNNPELTTFYCANNQLKSIDFSNNPKLRRTYLRTNELTSLDFSKNNKLEYMTCYQNKLETLNFSGCSVLQHAECYENQLTTLNISECSALEYISCRENKLTELDASDCPKLVTLACQKNQLKTLKISATKMETLFCEENQLTIANLPVINSIDDYTYTPQSSVSASYPINNIDLKNEYMINGATSVFTWTDKNGTPVTPLKSENGIFEFDKSYIGNTLTCKITNEKFPDLTTEYHITLSSSVANNLLEKTVSIYSHAGTVYFKTEKPVTAKIYSITGALVRQIALGEGESVVSLPQGLYLVSLSNGTVQKVIIR